MDEDTEAEKCPQRCSAVACDCRGGCGGSFFPVAWFMTARHGTFLLAALCKDTWSASVLGTHSAGPHSDTIAVGKDSMGMFCFV